VNLELRRSDIGFGRVLVDDTGVTRRRLLSAQSIAWDAIRDYRLKIEIRGARLEVLYLVDGLDLLLMASDVRNGYRGDHRFRFGIELLGDAHRVAFNWRFRGVEIAIAQILRRIHPRLVQPVLAGFARHGIAQFGALTIGAHAIRWADKAALPRAAVESVELFNSSPLRLRVMARGKVWPYGQAELAEIPNVAAALELAEQQGYPVRGRELVARLALGPGPVGAAGRD
jgi:Bacterial PH domain